MTTKAKRKREEAWLLYDNDGTSPDWSFDHPTKAGRAYWMRNGRRLVHLTESDAAEVKALRRVVREVVGPDGYVRGHAISCRCGLCRAVAALKKALR